MGTSIYTRIFLQPLEQDHASAFDSNAFAFTEIGMSADSQRIDSACRSLFATHYHQLSDDFKDNPAVALKHMACHVQAAKDGPEQVQD